MQSLIIVGSTGACDEYVESLIIKYHIFPYHVEKFSEKVKIADVRTIKKKLSIAIHTEEKRLIVLCGIITTEAQNALLKTLEEPHEETLIVITADSKDSLLPTIISRCRLITLMHSEEVKEKDSPLFQHLEGLNRAYNYGSFYELMKEVNFMGEIGDFQKFILELRSFISKKLKENSFVNPQLVNLLDSLHQNYSLSERNNVNKRLLLEALFLNS